MELGSTKRNSHRPQATCRFVVFAKYKFWVAELERELHKRLYEAGGDRIQVANEDQQPGGVYCYAYRVVFPVSAKPLDGDLTIERIMKELDGIERDVEQALRVTQLAEMIE